MNKIVSLFYSFILLTVLLPIPITGAVKISLPIPFCDNAPDLTLKLTCAQLHCWDSESKKDSSKQSDQLEDVLSSNMKTCLSKWISWPSSITNISEIDPELMSHNFMSNSDSEIDLTVVESDDVRSVTNLFRRPMKTAFEIQYHFSTNNPDQNNVLAIAKSGWNNEFAHLMLKENNSEMNFFEQNKVKKSALSAEWPWSTNGSSTHHKNQSDTIPHRNLYSVKQDTVGPPGHQLPSLNFALHPLTDRNDLNQNAVLKLTSTKKENSKRREGGDNKDVYECMDLLCLCPVLQGKINDGKCFLKSKNVLKPALRKEYRQLTRDERNAFHDAISKLKRNGEYDRLVQWHADPKISGGAHSGPAFLPWHREYLKRFEIALRLINPNVSLPYWDSVLDGHLSNNADTSLFSENLMGEADIDGNVVNGFISKWNTKAKNFKRQVGLHGRPFTDHDIESLMKKNDLSSVMAYTTPKHNCPYQTDWSCLEYSQNNVLIWAMGDFFDQTTSANDPLFFLHHAFVDRIWEEWRIKKQTKTDRSETYPPDSLECSSEKHFAHSLMQPFSPLKNIDGLSNLYTSELYSYSSLPKCNSTKGQQCESEYLFCDLSHDKPKCVSKIRPGGNCKGYHKGENPCLASTCTDSICVMENSNESQSSNSLPNLSGEKEGCFNLHVCCRVWSSRGLCKLNEQHMSRLCMASCNKCTTNYKMNDACSDRDPQCEKWVERGDCVRDSLWMAENCRKSCKMCSIRREIWCNT